MYKIECICFICLKLATCVLSFYPLRNINASKSRLYLYSCSMKLFPAHILNINLKFNESYHLPIFFLLFLIF